MKFLREFLAAFFRILPVRAGENELEDKSAKMQRSLPTNFAAIALNGLFFPTAGRILGAGLLLTWFVSDLTPSATLVSTIIPIQYGLALIAQPLIAQWVSTREYRARYYTAQSILRAISWISLGVAAHLIGGSQSVLLLCIFFAVIIIDAVAAGLGNIVFSDTLAKVIPRKLRGQARSWRGIFGGIAAGIAGILIKYYFSEQSGVSAFGLLFAIAGILYALGGAIFLLIDEPKEKVPNNIKPQFSALWQKLGELWSNRRFRRFVYAESLLVPIMQALPLFTLFARRGFGLEIESLGLLLIADASAPIAGNFIWGRLADRLGNRPVIVIAALCGLLAPALSLFLYFGGNSSGFAIGLFVVIVFAAGITLSGIDLASKNFILDLAPDEAERPFYIGVNDSLVGLPTMLLVGAGVIVDLFGFFPVFCGLILLTFAGAAITFRLPNIEKN
jgi:MFS family permease